MPGIAALRALGGDGEVDHGGAAPSRGAEPLEHVPIGEAKAIERVLAVVRTTMEANYASLRPALRGQHPKTHAVVRAEMTVAEKLPEDLRRGIFETPGRRYRD